MPLLAQLKKLFSGAPTPRRHAKLPKEWYAFAWPAGRKPTTFGGKSGWRYPKQYWGPFAAREDAQAIVNAEQRKYGKRSGGHAIRRLNKREFAKLWNGGKGY